MRVYEGEHEQFGKIVLTVTNDNKICMAALSQICVWLRGRTEKGAGRNMRENGRKWWLWGVREVNEASVRRDPMQYE